MISSQVRDGSRQGTRFSRRAQPSKGNSEFENFLQNCRGPQTGGPPQFYTCSFRLAVSLLHELRNLGVCGQQDWFFRKEYDAHVLGARFFSKAGAMHNQHVLLA